MLSGREAQRVIHEERRHTLTRDQLARRRMFQQVSPEPGIFREAELESQADRAESMELLVEMSRSAEDDLRKMARRLAGRVVVAFAQTPTTGEQAGIGKLRRVRYRPGMDIDLDGSLETLLDARAAGTSPSADALSGHGWMRRSTGICLLVDRSGSMGGGRVLSAALAAAAIAQRTVDDYSVVAFADDAVVLKAQTQIRSTEAVVDDLLSLVGFGMTNLALALGAARAQLALSSAQRRIVILLSDCRATAGDDALPAARALDELDVLAPTGEGEEARRLAAAGRGRWVELGGPLEVPRALSAVMSGEG